MSKILTFGETLIRLDVVDTFNELSGKSGLYYIGGSELNVASELANMGNKVDFYSNLANNRIGKTIKRHILNNDIAFYGNMIDNSRIGTYYYCNGLGSRPSVVEYDRDYSSFKMNPLSMQDVNLEEVEHVHISGITAALSVEHQDFIVDLIKASKKNNITVSYDSNYRMKLWTQKEAGEFLKKILNDIDILFAGKLDFIYLLGMDENKSVDEMIRELFLENSNLDMITFTKRDVIDNNSHNLTGYLYTKEENFTTDTISFTVRDRVGGGDNFTANILDGILNGKDKEMTLNNAIESSIVQHTFNGDYTKYEKVENKGLTGVSR